MGQLFEVIRKRTGIKLECYANANKIEARDIDGRWGLIPDRDARVLHRLRPSDPLLIPFILGSIRWHQHWRERWVVADQGIVSGYLKGSYHCSEPGCYLAFTSRGGGPCGLIPCMTRGMTTRLAEHLGVIRVSPARVAPNLAGTFDEWVPQFRFTTYDLVQTLQPTSYPPLTKSEDFFLFYSEKRGKFAALGDVSYWNSPIFSSKDIARHVFWEE